MTNVLYVYMIEIYFSENGKIRFEASEELKKEICKAYVKKYRYELKGKITTYIIDFSKVCFITINPIHNN